jgi:16S rRNA (adenine1518-N6/adenine1519-N6)-dimethyltransferase
LTDRNIAEKMIKACRLSIGDWVLEIGPGLGALTTSLATSVKKLIAVEKDRQVCFALSELTKDYSNLEVMCDDFLEADLNRILAERPDKVKVIGNLPYYVTTPIIEKLIDNSGNFSSVFITVQKEVADRICARPREEDYSSLSCFVQFHMKPAILFTIGRNAFYPQPDVESAFMELSILPAPPVQVNDEAKLFAVIRAGFGQRRKTLLNSLFSSEVIKTDKAGLSALLNKIGIDPGIRAEELSLEDFALIANAI